MARQKRSGPRRRTDTIAELSPAQEFELRLGPARGGLRSAFASDAERRAAWRAHRERMAADGPLWADEHYGRRHP